MRTLFAAAALALLTPLAATADTASPAPSPAAAAPAAAVVHMHDSAFVPTTVTVRVGDDVRFVNDDDVEHDATAADGSFASPELDRGQTYDRVFATAGTFAYRCNDHTFMHGTIVVMP